MTIPTIAGPPALLRLLFHDKASCSDAIGRIATDDDLVVQLGRAARSRAAEVFAWQDVLCGLRERSAQAPGTPQPKSVLRTKTA